MVCPEVSSMCQSATVCGTDSGPAGPASDTGVAANKATVHMERNTPHCVACAGRVIGMRSLTPFKAMSVTRTYLACTWGVKRRLHRTPDPDGRTVGGP